MVGWLDGWLVGWFVSSLILNGQLIDQFNICGGVLKLKKKYAVGSTSYGIWKMGVVFYIFIID